MFVGNGTGQQQTGQLQWELEGQFTSKQQEKEELESLTDFSSPLQSLCKWKWQLVGEGSSNTTSREEATIVSWSPPVKYNLC